MVNFIAKKFLAFLVDVQVAMSKNLPDKYIIVYLATQSLTDYTSGAVSFTARLDYI
jgi:hypothetical protein